MPATEQTWRDQKLLHKVFGVICLLLLGATLWMLAADHARSWKDYQRLAMEGDLRVNQWRQEAERRQTIEEHEQISEELLQAKAQPIDASRVEDFQNAVQQDVNLRVYEETGAEEAAQQPDDAAARSDDANVKFVSTAAGENGAEASAAQLDFSDMDRQLKRFNDAGAEARSLREAALPLKLEWQQKESEAQLAKQAAEEDGGDAAVARAERLAEEAREVHDLYQEADEAATEAEADAAAEREKLMRRFGAYIRAAKFREESLLQERKFANADLDAKKAELGLAVRDNLPEELLEEIQTEIDEIRATRVAPLTKQWQHAKDHRAQLEKIVATINNEVEEKEKSVAESIAELERLETAFEQRESTFFVSEFPYLGKRWLELPILDAFNSPRQIDNLWTEGLTQTYGSFGEVRRFDRCTTCHQAMDKTMPGSAVEPAYRIGNNIQFRLATPTSDPEGDLSLEEVYGFTLDPADRSVIGQQEVSVTYVRQDTLAANATPLEDEDADQLLPERQLRQAALQPPEKSEGEEVRPGLLLGDVILQVNGYPVHSHAEVERQLLQTVDWGETITLTVRRGVPHPFASHPRLDLFVGSLSPHPMTAFACTICHEGQGSATEFKWASHTPNTPEEAREWRREYEWFNNHHWIHPMHPARMIESSCLRCHHEVTELLPSEEYPEPPAPKLTSGHRLISKYGCFGCHEINGYDGPERRIGPDMRLEPNFYAGALQLIHEIGGEESGRMAELLQLKEGTLQTLAESVGAGGVLEGLDLADPAAAGETLESLQREYEGLMALEQLEAAQQQRRGALDGVLPNLSLFVVYSNRIEALKEMKDLAHQVADDPTSAAARQRLLELMRIDQQREDQPALAESSHGLIAVLKDVETPGELRKAGPSLRHVKYKLDSRFMNDWIFKPSDFRETTRMPQFFQLWDHLDGVDPEGLHHSQAFEPLEVLGMTTYLLERSQEFDYGLDDQELTDAEPEDDQAKINRGKVLFQTRGCLACHNHDEFPDATEHRESGEIVQGPNLTGLGSKFGREANPNGRRWLKAWIKEPSRYHARTVMPDLQLEPFKTPSGETIDPIDDIVEYLLSSKKEGWSPELIATFPLGGEAEESASEDHGDHEHHGHADAGLKVDLQLQEDQIVPTGDLTSEQQEYAQEMIQKSLKDLTLDHLYQAFSIRAANEYYDTGIPETQREGTKGAEVELFVDQSDMTDRRRLMYIGRKAIGKYGCFGCHDIPGFEEAKPIGTGLADWGTKEPAKLAFEHIEEYLHHHAKVHGRHEEKNPYPGGPAYFHEALEHHHRDGFIWQKLTAPRSYDYHKTNNKGYNERLRMPQFPFNAREREEVITFVLGLIADPPAPKFIYKPEPRRAAILAGERVLEKFNCSGCHMLDAQQLDIAYPPDHFGRAWEQQLDAKIFPFTRARFSAESLAESAEVDYRGLLNATLSAMPVVDQNGVAELYSISEEEPLYAGERYRPSNILHQIEIWQPAPLSGRAFTAGITPFSIPDYMVSQRRATDGGYLAKMLLPHVVAYEKQLNPDDPLAQAWASMYQTNPKANGKEAWEWLPPPLMGEGDKVQTDWLHRFLLEPHVIRPSAVLRMPDFNMSSGDASALVNYFAAVSEADYPYEYNSRGSESHLELANAEYQRGLEEISEGEAPEHGETRLDHAMNIVAKVCVTCHVVGDFTPTSSQRALAPDLAEVHARIRPDYMRQWIAYPKSILPYTRMPVNIPYNNNQSSPENLELYHGTSTEQVDALADLLMNYDAYAKRQSKVSPLVKALAPKTPEVKEAAEE